MPIVPELLDQSKNHSYRSSNMSGWAGVRSILSQVVNTRRTKEEEHKVIKKES